MKEILKLVGVLTIICALAGLLLAWVDQVTREPIAAAMRAEKMTALKQVLPECDNQPDQDVVRVKAVGREWGFHVARMGGDYRGCAFETVSGKGYGGSISLMVGLNEDGAVRGIRILEQKETPGLGAKVTSPEFCGQFEGMTADTDWRVARDGGDVDEITAATISSRAVAEAIRDGFAVYLDNTDTIRAGLKD